MKSKTQELKERAYSWANEVYDLHSRSNCNGNNCKLDALVEIANRIMEVKP